MDRCGRGCRLTFRTVGCLPAVRVRAPRLARALDARNTGTQGLVFINRRMFVGRSCRSERQASATAAVHSISTS